MKLLHLNVRGLWSNFAHIISEILSSHKFIDIFGFTETHITDEPGELFDLPCYTYINKPIICIMYRQFIVCAKRFF